MIKKIIVTASVFFFALFVKAQTAAEWQADLKHLQQTVHTKYSNLFYNISAADWDKEVEKLNTAIPTMNDQQRLAGLIKLVALFHVGHTRVGLSSLHNENAKTLKLHRNPYQLYWFSEGLYILRADNKYVNAVGGKVTKIGNMKTEDALEAVRPLVSYENEQGYRENSVFFLANPELMHVQGVTNSADETAITYTKNGKEETVIFKPEDFVMVNSTGLITPAGWTDARQPGNTSLWQKEPAAFRYMEYLPANKTLYVRHSAVANDGDNTIELFFNKMADYIEKNDVQKLVLDLRTNSGGNNYLNKPVITSIIRSEKINQKGKFFCILGRRTFSAAQNLVNELEKYTEVTFVGEPTSENVNFYGDTKTETLPNSKLQVGLSWLWWQNSDPRDKRKATAPHVAVDMSFNDYYNNNDPVLKTVLEGDKIKPLVPTLTQLINAGKKEAALQYAIDYKKDPAYRYYFDRIEADINQEGYNNLQSQPVVANALFEINMKLFPESANAYDSYAESFLSLGKQQEAIKYYELAIAKDKNGATAENAKNMIARIKSGH